MSARSASASASPSQLVVSAPGAQGPEMSNEPRGLVPRDLATLQKPSALTLSPDGQFAAFSVSRWNAETGVTARKLLGLDLSGASSRDLFPPFTKSHKSKGDDYGRINGSISPFELTNGSFADGSPLFLSDRLLAFLSNRKNDGTQEKNDISGVWYLNVEKGPSAPRLLYQPPLPISNLATLRINPSLILIFFSAKVSPNAPTLEGTAALHRLAEKSTGPKSSARVHDDLFIRHWDTWVDTEHLEQLFVLPVSLDSEPQVAGKPVNLMAGSNWQTPVAPFGGAEDFAFAKSSLDWSYFGLSQATEGVERIQAIFSSRRPATGSEKAWTTDTSLFLVLFTLSTSDAGFNIEVKMEPTDLTPLPTYASNPAFNSNGTQLAYLETREPGNEADRRRIVILDLAALLDASKNSGGIRQSLSEPDPEWKKTLVEDWDRSPGSLVWEAFLWMTADEHGRTRAFVLDPEAKDKEPRRISVAGHLGSLLPLPLLSFKNERVRGDMSVEKETMSVHRAVSLHSTSSRPDEVAVVWMLERETTVLGREVEKKTKVERSGKLLTDLHSSDLAGISLSKAEEFTFKSHGTRVHAFFFPPVGKTANSDGHVPLAMLIHGGPESSWQDSWGWRWNYQIYTSAGWAVLAVNPRGSTGYGQKFTDAVRGDWGGRPFDDLMEGLDVAIDRFGVDTDRMVALGASYGGFMINWVNGHTDRFKALVCHDGVFQQFVNYYATDELFFPESEFGGAPFSNSAVRLKYEEHNPERFVAKWKTPTLVIHGELDFRLGVEQGIAAFTALRRRGVPSRLLVFPDEGHWVLKPANQLKWYEEMLGWIARFGLNGTESHVVGKSKARL